MTEVEWPWQYSFPPFFTLQPHLETRQRQLETWKLLVIDYFKLHKLCTLDLREASRSPLFYNKTIDRKLDSDFILVILTELEKTGHAASLDKGKQRWEIYWYTLREIANFVHKWVSNNGMLNTVCTLNELTTGDDTVAEEFYGLEKEVFIKVLKVLEKDMKCELIDDQGIMEGVKFF